MNEIVPASSFAGAMAIANDLAALASRVIDADGKGWRDQAKLASEIEMALKAAQKAAGALNAATRPATPKEVGVALAMLLKAFPNMGKGELREFGELLALDVIDQGPSIAAVVTGCAEIRRTSEFPPTIATVLKAIAEVDSRLRAAKTRLELLPVQAARLRKQAADGARQEAKRRGGEAD